MLCGISEGILEYYYIWAGIFWGEGIWGHSLERGEKFTNLEAETRNDALSDAVRED